MITPDQVTGLALVAVALGHVGADLDHDVCDECAAPICNDTPQCPNTLANGRCPHERTLCAVCVPSCRGCRLDLIEQGVMSQYGPRGPWGGAA